LFGPLYIAELRSVRFVGFTAQFLCASGSDDCRSWRIMSAREKRIKEKPNNSRGGLEAAQVT
jgi:hypothetical protein